MQKLIELKDWCAKNGYTTKWASELANQGRIPGAVKALRQGSKICRWMVPADAVRPEPQKKGRPKMTEEERRAQKWKPPVVVLPRIKPVLPTMHDKCEYIRKHCLTKSYRELAEDTGMSYAEIRRVYERLHERYGI